LKKFLVVLFLLATLQLAAHANILRIVDSNGQISDFSYNFTAGMTVKNAIAQVQPNATFRHYAGMGDILTSIAELEIPNANPKNYWFILVGSKPVNELGGENYILNTSCDQRKLTSSENIVLVNQPDKNSSIALSKKLPDNHIVNLTGHVTAKFADRFYLQDPSAPSAIQVYSGQLSQITVGDEVSLLGILAHRNQIREINRLKIDFAGPPEDNMTIKPYLMCNDSLGGFNSPNQPGVPDSEGPNNVNLLIKTFGQVKEIGDNCIFINDGSRPDNLKVYSSSIPTINNYFLVTGISSIEQVDGVNKPVIYATQTEVIQP
jgi:hypothetical protein